VTIDGRRRCRTTTQAPLSVIAPGNTPQYVGSVKKAYDANRGPKVLVRYENLSAETLDIMERITSR